METETLPELSEQRAKVAVSTLQSFVWTNYLYPRVTEECSKYLQILAHKKSDDDDIKRGWIQALTWVANLPKTDIDEQRMFEEENIRQREEHEDDPETSRGRKSPFVVVQNQENE